MALLDHQERSADALCLEPCRCLELDFDDFQALLWEEPAIAINMNRVLSRRLRQTGSDMAIRGRAEE